MRRFVLSTAFLMASIASGAAADMAAPTFSVAPTYNWVGFYAGLNAGGARGWIDSSTMTAFSPAGWFAFASVQQVDLAGSQTTSPIGFTGGLEAGYNWQVDYMVFGVEGDIESLLLSGSAATGPVTYRCCAPAAFTVSASGGTSWLATARGRLGVAADNWLLFGTAGLAFTNLNGTFSFADNCSVVLSCSGGFANTSANEAVSFSQTKVGWTAGAGIEAGLWGGWTAKAEYLYVNFGAISATGYVNPVVSVLNLTTGNNPFTHSFDLKANIARLGVNYRF